MNRLVGILTLFFLMMTHQTHLIGESLDKYLNINNKKYKRKLENSVWVVPPTTLLAYEYLNGEHIPVQDQTVWVINKYHKGYFFGDSYTSLDGNPDSHKNFVGSITPQGVVYITFYPLSENEQQSGPVNGVGKLEKHRGEYFFVMQVNSPLDSVTGLSHVSYMISVRPNDFFYQHLPSVDISVPDFISQF